MVTWTRFISASQLSIIIIILSFLCAHIFLCLCGVCGVVFARNPVFCFVVFDFIFYMNQFSGPSGSQIRCKYFVNKVKVSVLTFVYFNKHTPKTWLLKL